MVKVTPMNSQKKKTRNMLETGGKATLIIEKGRTWVNLVHCLVLCRVCQ